MPGETIAIWNSIGAGDEISTSPPVADTLYHYTTLDPFRNIIETGEIWASNVFYLNDSEEILYGFKKIASSVSEIERSNTDIDVSEACHQLKGWILNNAGNYRQVFVCSFSENGNQLSQWRSYCTPGKGVSIGMKRDTIATRMKEIGFELARCLYDDDEQEAAVARVVDEIIVDARNEGPDERSHPEQSYHKSFEKNVDAIYRLCARIKHPCFKEEAEWRVVSPPFERTTDPRIHYREGKSTLVPYVKMKIRDSNGVLDIPSVVIGPSPNISLSIHAVSNLLSSNNVRGGTVYNSSIPFKSW